mmetsp:Transcript_154413/g.284478  ORF Transcript_154413/g.284478 Transcript_154413/m.284478 type:complete len:220 (-) Transcript_154413:242-901(-)
MLLGLQGVDELMELALRLEWIDSRLCSTDDGNITTLPSHRLILVFRIQDRGFRRMPHLVADDDLPKMYHGSLGKLPETNTFSRPDVAAHRYNINAGAVDTPKLLQKFFHTALLSNHRHDLGNQLVRLAEVGSQRHLLVSCDNSLRARVQDLAHHREAVLKLDSLLLSLLQVRGISAASGAGRDRPLLRLLSTQTSAVCRRLGCYGRVVHLDIPAEEQRR